LAQDAKPEILDEVSPVKSNLYKLGLLAALLVLLGGSILHALGGGSVVTTSSDHTWGNDDAYISFHYARNLAQGNGLVLNPGEPVEAYSNFLYVLLLAPGFGVTDSDGIYFFSLFLNLIFAGAAFWLFARYLQQQLGEAGALIGACILAVCLPLWVAVGSGLETTLVLLISLSIWITVEDAVTAPSRGVIIRLAALLTLSLLARADGFVIAGIAILYLLLKRRFPDAAICAVTVLAAGGAYVLWRYHYYGYPLPNSYYVKVSGGIGPRLYHAYDQLKNAALFEGLLPLLLVWLFALVEVVRKRLPDPRAIAGSLRFDLFFPALWLAYWFYIGGDNFWDRFLIILYPLGIFTLLKYLAENASAKITAYVAVMLVVLEVLPPFNLDPRFQYNFNKYDCWITTGKFLGQNYRGKTLATSALGKIPFFSGLYAEDILGLGDPVIAHRPVASPDFDPGHMKFDPDYTLGRHPDLITDWIFPTGDLAYGITKAKYQDAGYRVVYLVSSRRIAPPQPIVPAGGMNEQTLQAWVSQGYNFAILARQ
jgi:hypothetical protein